MATYYWYKYYCDETHTYSEGSWSDYRTSTADSSTGYESYSFSTSTGQFSNVGSMYTYQPEDGTHYYASGDVVYRMFWDASGNFIEQIKDSYISSTTHAKGSYISTTTGSYNYKVDGAHNSDGYWWERGSEVNNPPSAPTVEAPTLNESIVGVYRVSWTASNDDSTAQSNLQYHVQLSTDNGATYQDLIALTPQGQTYLDHDFSTEVSTNEAIIRVRAYDGAKYGSYGVSDVFAITHKSQIGTYKIDTSSGIVDLPIYDTGVGMEGKNQLRVALNETEFGCFELVDVTDASASPLRANTANGIKAIAK